MAQYASKRYPIDLACQLYPYVVGGAVLPCCATHKVGCTVTFFPRWKIFRQHKPVEMHAHFLKIQSLLKCMSSWQKGKHELLLKEAVVATKMWANQRRALAEQIVLVMETMALWREPDLMALFLSVSRCSLSFINLLFCTIQVCTVNPILQRKKGWTHSRALGGSGRNASWPLQQWTNGCNDRGGKSWLKLFFLFFARDLKCVSNLWLQFDLALAHLNLLFGCY